MKTTIPCAAALFAAAVLAACASTVAIPQRSDQDTARLMAANDYQIVPSDGRVGRIFIGMTEAQLYQRMGSPDSTTHGYWSDVNQDAPNYTWGGVTASMLSGKVFTIRVASASFQTAEGVAVGSPELAVTAKLGAPAWNVLEFTGQTSRKLCFNPDGLLVIVDKGQVTRMELSPGGCK